MSGNDFVEAVFSCVSCFMWVDWMDFYFVQEVLDVWRAEVFCLWWKHHSYPFFMDDCDDLRLSSSIFINQNMASKI